MNQEIIKILQKLTEEEIEILCGKDKIDKNRYMNSKYSTVIDSKKLLERNKLITVRTHTRFIHFPKHNHNYVEVVYMCEGSTTHIINSEKVVLKKGELLFLSQNAIQEIEEAGKDDIAVNFIILPEFFERSLIMLGEEENLVRDFIVGCLRSKNSTISYLHFKVADVLPIQNLIENLIWTLMNKQQNKRNINQTTMGLLILQLLGYLDKMTTGLDNLENEIIVKVYQFIEEMYKDGKLSNLAKNLGYDLYWLSRMIKKITGQTYTELLQTKRLNQAIFLLTTTKLPISDIGYAVGYNNLSYFYKIFKKKYNLSPKEYRRKATSKTE